MSDEWPAYDYQPDYELIEYLERPSWNRLRRRKRGTPMPSEFEPLAVYNAENARGIAHTERYDAEMAVLQRNFNAWRLRDRAVAGGVE